MLLVFTGTVSMVSCGDDDENAIDDIENNGNFDTESSDFTGSINGHAYVDLGLSVKWATSYVFVNNGGGYFAWGETEPRTSFYYNNYLYFNNNSYTNLGTNISGGIYDAAKKQWGDLWRMPTKSEMQELITKCTWTWNSTDKGYDITGPNGSKLFIKAAGHKVGSASVDGGKNGFYWTATLDNTSAAKSKAFCLSFDNSNYSIESEFRTDGMRIIPVTIASGDTEESGNDDNTGGSTTTYEKPEIGFYDFTATKTSLKVQYKIYNKDEAKVTSAKIYYGTSSNPSSSKTATVSGVLITANISGLKAGTSYYVKCTATGKGGTTTTSVVKCITEY